LRYSHLTHYIFPEGKGSIINKRTQLKRSTDTVSDAAMRFEVFVLFAD
jgi:hypothetical protein